LVTKPPIWDPGRGQVVTADFVRPVHTVLSGPRLVSPPPAPTEAETSPAAAAAPARAEPLTRDEVLAHQAELRRERGAAVLDRRPFDRGDALVSAENALAILEDVDAEKTRRGDAAAAQAAADRHARLEARVGGLRVAIDDALRVGQDHMDAAVRGLTRARELSREIAEVARRANAPIAASLVRQQQDKRFGSMIAEALRPLQSTNDSVGDLTWHLSAFAWADWEQSERSATALDIAAIVGGKP
jgi:hypothetical protein